MDRLFLHLSDTEIDALLRLMKVECCDLAPTPAEDNSRDDAVDKAFFHCPR